MDENERKRKRELGIESDNENVDDQSDQEVDLDGETSAEGQRKNKKQKVDGTAEDNDVAKRATKAEKRKEKRQAKKEKVDKVKQKQDAKKSRKQDQDLNDLQADNANGDGEGSEDEDMEDAAPSADVDAMDFSGLTDGDDKPQQTDGSSAPSSPEKDTVFDASNQQSTASSSASSVPSKDATDKPKKEKALKLPEVDAEELQSRLRARIEELRARRKADGPNGQPARNRQELLETRRKKEEARKQHKKELRLKAKQEEERLNNDRLRGSGSPLNADIFSPRVEKDNFSFGRVAFEDGAEADASLTALNDGRKKKGPQDTRTALAAAEKKAARLAGLDEDKRKDIEEKDLWLNAKKKAHGERVRDDQNLLKKALKRQEKVKTKSATEWNERLDTVVKGKEMKDKRREANLAKRRDEKGSKKGGKKGGAKKGGAKKRPGFEGRFKA